MKATKIPPHLQAILWSVDINHLSLKKHKGYIIHQILRYGTIKDIKWLFNTYGEKKVREAFLQYPSKNYFKKNFYFIKNYILGLENLHLNEDDYVTSIHGKIRQRAAGSL